MNSRLVMALVGGLAAALVLATGLVGYLNWTMPEEQVLSFDAGYVSRRVCADAASPRADILSGGETVGAPIGAVRLDGDPVDGPVYQLAPYGEDSHDHAYFDVDGSGQVSVSVSGADDNSGMDGERLYSFLVRVKDAEGAAAETLATVLVDLVNLDTNGNGVCP